MNEADYFTELQALIDSRLFQVPTGVSGTYEIKEPGQALFEVNPAGLSSHKGVRLERLSASAWAFFKNPHPHAHRRCDLIVLSWDRQRNQPVCLLMELKTQASSGAWTQLQASLAFCQYMHHMLCINKQTIKALRVGAVAIKKLPFAQKMLSRPTLPTWNKGRGLDCPYMIYDRSTSGLPLRALVQSL